MALTLRAVLDELDRLSEYEGPLDEIGREQIVHSVARAALLGARGNSGVILSQLIRGAAEELISRPGELVDPVLIGAAMARAADRAYGSVRRPPRARSSPWCARWRTASPPSSPTCRRRGCTRRVGARRAGRAAGAAARAARSTPARRRSSAAPTCCRCCATPAWSTPAATGSWSCSPASWRRCAATRRRRSSTTRPARVTHPQHHSSSYRYCTNFAVTGEGLVARAVDRARSRRSATPCSWSATSTRSRSTSTPTTRSRRRACSTAPRRSRGSTSPTCGCRWPSAPAGSATAAARRPPAACSRWSRATGMAELFALARRGAARRRRRRSTRPPTTCWRASTASPAEEVVVLPNSPNVIMAAERAAELSDKTVRVVRVALPAGGARRRRRARPDAPARTANAAAMERGARPRPHRRGHRGGARRHRRSASAAARRSASSTSSSWPGASRRRRSRPCSARSAADAELVTLIAGRRRAARPGRRHRARARRGRASSTPTAASRATGG